jgi:hypothetical protein
MMTTDLPTGVVPFDGLSRDQRRRLMAHAALRTLLTISVVVVIYYLVPMDKAMTAATIAGLAFAGIALVAVIGYQVRKISRSDYPAVRAVESLAFTLPVYILFFATLYYLLNHANAATFGTSLSRTDTMYFSTTVFSTVGFGDITAKTETARIIVTCQMILDLLILGLVARLIVNAIKIGLQRHAAADSQTT